MNIQKALVGRASMTSQRDFNWGFKVALVLSSFFLRGKPKALEESQTL